MDPHRNYPADQPDGQWYQQERGYQPGDWDRPGGDPRYPEQQQPYGQQPYGDYHVPEPRAEHRYPSLNEPAEASNATTQMAPLGPRSGEPLPPLHGDPGAGAPPVSPAAAGGYADDRAGEQAVRHATEPLDRSALRRQPPGPGPLGDGVYRSRRPGTAAALVAATVVLELIALRLLWVSLTGRPVLVGGGIASAFLAVGLPMFGLGLYGLLGGSAGAPGAGARVWLRTPLVYLPVALVLFVAAGLAA